MSDEADYCPYCEEDADVVKVDDETGFFGCPAGAGGTCDPRAHGNVTVTEHCACGATRRVAVNGGAYGAPFHCAGPWIHKDDL